MSSLPSPAVDGEPRPIGAFWRAFDRWTAGFRGPIAAALVAMAAALPGLFGLPPLDRDESRFAQATAQMLETGDFINIRYQGDPRDKKPVGIHWLQAASVGLVSSVESREIWAYRIPSLLGAMAAAAACAWGAATFFGPRGGVLAGLMLGSSFILSSEAFIAKTDAVLCGATTVSLAALARLYGASKGVGRAGSGAKALFWLGQAIAILDKGPIGPMVAGLALISLWIADREAAWCKSLGWVWGLIAVALIVGPWAAAITVDTDGSFWTGAVQGDLAPKLRGGHESHGAPPGLHAALLGLLMFPASVLAPAAAIAGWTRRKEPGVRFALAWLIPAWVVFELLPTKLVHYTLPLYGAVAWLAAAAAADPQKAAFGWRSRIGGAVLSILASAALAAAIFVVLSKYASAPGAWPWAALTAALCLGAGAGGAAGVLRSRPEGGLLAALVLGVGAHMSLTGGLMPRMTAFWTSARLAERLTQDHLDPRNGVITGPVAVVGYAEPSLIFALGTGTELDTAADAAESVADGQPALVEKRQATAFQAALQASKTAAQPVDEVKGFDYSVGKPVDLTIWRSLAPQPTGETNRDTPD